MLTNTNHVPQKKCLPKRFRLGPRRLSRSILIDNIYYKINHVISRDVLCNISSDTVIKMLNTWKWKSFLSFITCTTLTLLSDNKFLNRSC